MIKEKTEKLALFFLILTCTLALGITADLVLNAHPAYIFTIAQIGTALGFLHLNRT